MDYIKQLKDIADYGEHIQSEWNGDYPEMEVYAHTGGQIKDKANELIKLIEFIQK
jgi:hypothetical protein